MIPIALQAWMFLTPVDLSDRSRSGRLDLAPAPQPDDRRGPGRALGRAARRRRRPDLLGLALLAGEFVVLFLGGVVTFHKIDAVLADRILS